MAALSNHVSLTITQDSVGVARAGFGVPMLLSATAAWSTDLIRFYNSLAEVAEDFPSTTGPEYLAATALFSQDPRPEMIAIGRTATARRPTLKCTITPTVVHSASYALNVKGDGVTATECTYPADSATTATEICDGIRADLDAVVGKNYTTSGTTTVVVTGDAAGEWFSLEVVDPSLLSIVWDHADPGVATDLAAIALVDSSWYTLITMYNSDAYVKAAAAWIETQKKIYVFDTNETPAINIASDGTQGTLDDLKALGYGRTAGFWHHEPAQFGAAGWCGAVLPLEPGEETWKFKSLAGIEASSLTATQRTNLVNRNANGLETVAGVKVTFNGTTTDGEFLDVQRGLDWLEDDMTAAVFGALAGASKIPYTDAGVAVIESEMRGSLRRAVDKGILTSNPAPTVTVPKVADIASADRTARNLPDMKFAATLAGAIHKVTISGVVSV